MFKVAPPVTRAPSAGKGLALSLRGLLPWDRYGSGPAAVGEVLTADGKGFATFASIAVSNPACRVYASTGQTIADSANTALLFDTERYKLVDPGMHSTSSNTSRLTCVTAGVYAISMTVAFASNAAGSREADIRLNGGTFIAGNSLLVVAAGTLRINTQTQYQLAKNDYVEAIVFQNTGGNLTVFGNDVTPNYSAEFMMAKVA